MYGFIIVVHIIACFILIASILLQAGRGGGLAGLFGSGATQTIFGARASTFLTRATTVAAIVFLLSCISLTMLSSRRMRSLMSGAETKPVSEETKPEQVPQVQEEKPAASEAKTEEVQDFGE